MPRSLNYGEIIEVLEIYNSRKEDQIMATLADLTAAIAALKTDVAALIAATAAPAPVDVQAEVDAVNAIDASVKAATPPPPAPVA